MNGWLQAQNYLMLPDVKQEPASPNYAAASSSTTPPPPHRYTPSPNLLNPASISPNLQIQGVQPNFDIGSPLQFTNTLIPQQYQAQPNENQFNIPNTNIVNAAVNFLNNNNTNQSHQEQRNIVDNPANNNLNINQLDNAQNENVLDSGMNLSSLLNLDSQQINTNELMISNDMLNELLNNIGNSETNNPNQSTTPMTINTIQTNTFDADEENMTDSFNKLNVV